jgi:hypothetical protein
MGEMIGLGLLEEIIETILWTGNIRDGIPLSCFLISDPGSGKSRTLIPFHGPSLHRSDDMTSSGLLDIMERDKEGKVKHILISDFNAILSHKSSTTNLTMGNLLSLMSEGTVRIDDGRRNKEIPHAPIGLIVGITPKMFESKFPQWDMIGFRRRFLPIFYCYKAETVREIMKSIGDGKTSMASKSLKNVVLPPKQNKPAWNDTGKRYLDSLAFQFTENLAQQPRISYGPDRSMVITPETGKVPLPFTPMQMLQEIAEAHALRGRSGRVREEDLKFASMVVDFTRYGRPVAL